MRFDPWGLGYTVWRGALSVHYATRGADGVVRYGAGLPFDHTAEMRRNPESERSVLWREMLSADQVPASVPTDVVPEQPSR